MTEQLPTFGEYRNYPTFAVMVYIMNDEALYNEYQVLMSNDEITNAEIEDFIAGIALFTRGVRNDLTTWAREYGEDIYYAIRCIDINEVREDYEPC